MHVIGALLVRVGNECLVAKSVVIYCGLIVSET